VYETWHTAEYSLPMVECFQICISGQKGMAQLKGKLKETNKQKRERKKDFVQNKRRAFTIVLPTLAAVFIMIAVYIYFKTRPKTNIDF